MNFFFIIVSHQYDASSLGQVNGRRKFHYYLSFSFIFYVEINDVFFLLGSCQRTPTISYISPEQIKDIGGTVELSCSVQYGQDYPVLWMKTDRQQGDQTPISNRQSLIIKDSRFSIVYHSDTSTYRLQVGKPRKKIFF